MSTSRTLFRRRYAGGNDRRLLPVLFAILALVAALPAAAEDPNNPGIMEPVSTHLNEFQGLPNPVVRIPNTDQSVDGEAQSTIHGEAVFLDALTTTSLLGHPITHVESPNFDMWLGLQAMATSAQAGDAAGMEAAANELMDILLGTTEGRIYDGFGMLNFNRWHDGRVGPEHFPDDAVFGEYKMKVARDTGETFISPYDGEERRIWEVDVNMLYYDGQIDSDTFLLKFPFGHHEEDTVRVNYRIYSMVQEDFSPTLVMLDKRQALNTVQFPFKGFDSVWIAFFPGQVLDVTLSYPPLRQLRGVYTWGWREHPPRIQFLQPVYEIENQVTGNIELDSQGISYATRNRENLTLGNISEASPEMKMYRVAQAVLNGGVSPSTIAQWLTLPNFGPRGTWVEWGDLVTRQTQLPAEAWEMVADRGITPTSFGEYDMVTAYMNNEMYGEGPWENEIQSWEQGDVFNVLLINLDNHTHYFRNVDFGTRLNDDILRCCGGGETSFEIMNFKPSYGAPKVAEMQWRAGWGFRPHYDVIQQQGVFPRGSDRVKLKPYTGGGLGEPGGTFFGYQYSEESRQGDFRFNPPPFIIGVSPFHPDSSLDFLRDADGETGLVIGQFTEGYGVAQMCPGDRAPGFCQDDISAYNFNGALNFPPPPLRGQPVFPEDIGKFPGDIYPDEAVELRFPPFLRNPSQGVAGAGDIIPPTGSWRPFLFINPNNGTLFIDPDQPELGYWSDLTYSHGAPVFAGSVLDATIELPRASGQVFYQFDDLFHDNSIFSPHPLEEGGDLEDAVSSAKASLRDGALRVSGQLSELEIGGYAGWVTIVDGTASDSGCAGTVLGTTTVDATTGRFVYLADVADGVGDSVCVQSTVSGVAQSSVRKTTGVAGALLQAGGGQ